MTITINLILCGIFLLAATLCFRLAYVVAIYKYWEELQTLINERRERFNHAYITYDELYALWHNQQPPWTSNNDRAYAHGKKYKVGFK